MPQKNAGHVGFDQVSFWNLEYLNCGIFVVIPPFLRKKTWNEVQSGQSRCLRKRAIQNKRSSLRLFDFFLSPRKHQKKHLECQVFDSTAWGISQLGSSPNQKNNSGYMLLWISTLANKPTAPKMLKTEKKDDEFFQTARAQPPRLIRVALWLLPWAGAWPSAWR